MLKKFLIISYALFTIFSSSAMSADTCDDSIAHVSAGALTNYSGCSAEQTAKCEALREAYFKARDHAEADSKKNPNKAFDYSILPKFCTCMESSDLVPDHCPESIQAAQSLLEIANKTTSTTAAPSITTDE